MENEVKERELFDVPGIGEFRARPGTSTAELAGAVSVWSKRAKAAEAKLAGNIKSGFFTGLISGGCLVALIEIGLKLLH